MKQQEVIQSIAHLLEQAKIPYTIVEEAALYVQGMALHCADIKVLVQWDVFSACYELFAAGSRSDIGKTAAKAEFTVQYEGMPVHIFCLFNTTVRTDPYRIEENGVWCRSLYSYLYGTDFSAYKTEITRFLHNKQQALTAQNEQAWNQSNYQALLARYGDPAEVAKKIQQNPEWRIYPFGKYMPNLNGKKVLHLLGSNGVKATAMATLGADVTVVDFSQENAKFAEELANAAEVDINYIVSDVFSMPEKQGEFDYVLMELGVLHYFITLEPLMELIKETLAPGGRFILHEFHPISTKLITSNGKKHKVTGNYFAPELTYQSVAFSKHMPDGVQEELLQTVQRKWTIGELVTSVAASGLRIEILEEEPNHKLHDIGLPKTYTLVAEK